MTRRLAMLILALALLLASRCREPFRATIQEDDVTYAGGGEWW